MSQFQQKDGIGLILAGGRSQRLFPVETPKPLLKVDGITLLDRARSRLSGMTVVVVCNSRIRRAIQSVTKKKPYEFIVEPEPRDTAAAIGFALRKIKSSSHFRRKKWMAVMSADHYFPKPGFDLIMEKVRHEMEIHPDCLFVLGSPASFKPRENHSQFGWIVPKSQNEGGSFKVDRFVEKPSQEALNDLYRFNPLINGGMFFGAIETFRGAFERLFPEAIDSKIPFGTLPKQPVDRAIFEKFDRVRVISLDLPWEDLGTWSDWWRLGLMDPKLKLTVKESDRVYVWSDEPFDFSVFGLKDVAVIKAANKIMVMPLSETPNLKKYLS